MPTVHASYYTDPACPVSWGLEPVVRRLRLDFGADVELTYVMGGLARRFDAPERFAARWLAAADATAMPVDARLWLDAEPPSSSHPACLAVVAAAEQGDPGPYLRGLREGFACRRRRLDAPDALVEQARGVAGLDAARLRIDLASNAIVERFGMDLERLAEAGARAPRARRDPDTGRVALPALELRGADGVAHAVYGGQSYETYAAAARAAGATPADAPPLAVEDALRRFGALATPEVAILCDLPGPRAAAELWRLAVEWRVRPQRLGSGELWSLA